MNSIYRLYVGLSSNVTSSTIDADHVIAWLARQVDSFTVLTTQGFFRGRAEDTLVLSIAHDDQPFIVNLAHKLRATLNQEGIGLEYSGTYQRLTYANDPLIYELARQPRRYPNFNVRVHSDLQTHRNWCRANDVEVRVFENFDSGGWNFFIFEFKRQEDAETFATRFAIHEKYSLWMETAQGEVDYIELPAAAGTRG